MSDLTTNPVAARTSRLRLLIVTTFSVFIAEVLVMLLVENWWGYLPLLVRVFLDASLLGLMIFPALYFLVYRKMAEQYERRLNSERLLEQLNRTLGAQIEERTARLQRTNEELLGQVRERALAVMSLSQAVKEANESRASLLALFNAISDGVLAVDAGGVVQLANPAAEDLLGHPAGTLAGRTLADLLTPAFTAKDLAAFLSLGEPGETRTFAWRAAEQELPGRVEMRLGGACLWQDEPAAILLLRGVG